ncbi:phage late control D family protein [Mixta intestinalis]|uniref:Phage late control D family protein n=1 Tax=Mixta intestinalis TaxID=1615494 RepID=A0A6P1Q2Z4_9GAMM|nr:phage late control D family protein [Mixta intestinalis]QHM72469.1 hypothetical protein C7M51_02782 [Mixta intestinalis]
MSELSRIPVQIGTLLAPDFLIQINNKDVTTSFRERLIELKLSDNRGFEADRLTISLDDTDGQLVLPPRGGFIKLFIGWKGQALLEKGEYIIDTVTHSGAPDKLSITANSIDYRGRMNVRREASYHETTLEAVVKQVAERHRLKPVIAEKFKNIEIKHIDQTQETDSAFISRLASLYGAVAVIKMENLLFFEPGGAVTASGKPVPPLTLVRQDGNTHIFSIADRGAYTGVVARWLDTKDTQPKQVTLQRKNKGQSHTTGQQGAEKSQTSTEPDSYLMGSADNVLVLSAIYKNKEEAISAAKAKWQEFQRSVATFTLKLANGRADLIPEMPVKVSGFKSVIDAQSWLIKSVEHSISNGGYINTLELEAVTGQIEYEMTEG